jgi:hypothetical protein
MPTTVEAMAVIHSVNATTAWDDTQLKVEGGSAGKHAVVAPQTRRDLSHHHLNDDSEALDIGR